MLISNWTRHITSCIEVPKQKQIGTSMKLDKFFGIPSPVSSPSPEIFTSPDFCLSTSESTNSEQSMESSTSENTDLHFELPPSDNAHNTQEGDSEVVVNLVRGILK